MNKVLSADGIDVPVEIVLKPIRSRYRLSISEKGARLSIHPRFAGDADGIIGKHAKWIRNHFLKLKESAPASEIADGSEIPFLGRKCRLEISPGENIVSYDRENSVLHMRLSDSNPENLKNRLCLWYLSQSANFARILAGRLGAVDKFGVTRIVLKDMRTRWGTCCHRRKIVTLNWRLILAPEEIYEYVFMHELAHLKVAGHGRGYWNYVESLLPGALEKRYWLNRNGHPLMSFLPGRRISPERVL